MAIGVGDRIPEGELLELGPDGMEKHSTAEIFGGKKVVMFAVPGAFTPTCSAQHMPSYLDNIDALKGKGVDEVICIAVNDPFVMKEWGKASGAEGKVRLLSDGSATLTKAMGLEFDGGGFGMGIRSQRYAMVVEDGVVKALNVEKPGAFEVSSAEAIMKDL
jgi:peroxiredoxin